MHLQNEQPLKKSNNNTYFIGITTHQRVDYIKDLFQSISKTILSKNKYIIVVNDDNSTDGTKEYITNYLFPNNVEFHILNTNNVGVHSSKNNIFLFSLTKTFDFGFMLDDDLIFLKEGWCDLFYNVSLESGYEHLTFYDRRWKPEKFTIVNGKLVSYTNVIQSQGAFYTFTKNMLRQIGFIDRKNFGFRGLGHGDLSHRACRVGLNNHKTFWGVNGSEKYIKLQPKETYKLTPNYDKTLKIERENIEYKRSVLLNPDRLFVPPQPSIINYFFDKVYLINLNKRSDRLGKMVRFLNILGVEYERIEAVDGNYEIEKYNEGKKLNKEITPGVIGCHLSHLKVFKDIKEKGYKRPLILEDDLIAHNDLNQLLFNLFDIDNDWDLLYLGTSDWEYGKNKKSYNGKTHYIGKNINSTFAYSPKPEIIDELIKEFEKPISIPCDTLLHNFQNNAYVMEPKPFFVELNDSDIRDNRSNSQIKSYLKQINIDLNHYQNDIIDIVKKTPANPITTGFCVTKKTNIEPITKNPDVIEKIDSETPKS